MSISFEDVKELIDKGKAHEQNRILGIIADAEHKFAVKGALIKYISDRIQDEE